MRTLGTFILWIPLLIDLIVGRRTSDGTNIFEECIDLETASVDFDESSCVGVWDA